MSGRVLPFRHPNPGLEHIDALLADETEARVQAREQARRARLRKALVLLALSALALACVGARAWGWEPVVRVMGGLVAFVGGVALLAAISARWESESEGRVIPGRQADR